ncbi:MAG: lysoplasmalogenase [Xanthomonadales bacterium]|nr:hypothetical protein [Xanthomonadales bacterium]MCC6594398.1 lysoplasmalogenase [Xanthomonadales bacterium]MCE7932116.1 lysoplasmalogenase [Xanthomonadales bacterium PRO6]
MRHTHWRLLVIVVAMIAIGAHYFDHAWLHYIAKPAATLLIAAHAMTSTGGDAGYRRWVIVGLLWSTLGDVLLMLPWDAFLYGLLAFLVAHLCYLLAFSRRARFAARRTPFTLYALVACGILTWLWQGIPASMRLPVIVYVAALGSMAAQAFAIWLVRRDAVSASAAIGGALFLCSDSLIAINRFAEPFEASRLLILTSYWVAQWLLARSITRVPE